MAICGRFFRFGFNRAVYRLDIGKGFEIMGSKVYGYARVSTKEQHLDRQLEALRAAGIADRDIITDKQSGKDFSRPGWQTLTQQILRNGDTLVIKELDRLGRNYEQIKSEWAALIDAGIEIVVLDTPMLNTNGKTDLEKRLISNIVFELLAYLAEKERIKIKARQAEGIAIAKAEGRKMGRPAKQAPDNWQRILSEWKAGHITAVQAIRQSGYSKTKFYEMIKADR